MAAFNVAKLKELKEAFTKVTKRVLKKNISRNSEKLEKYECSITTYNTIIGYVAHYYNDLNAADRETIRDELLRIRDKLVGCFQKLNLKYKLPTHIIEQIKELEPLTDSELGEEEECSKEEDNLEMSTKHEYKQIAAANINKNYTGDPLSLNAFINSVNLLITIARQAHATFLRQFILSKLEGKALECVPTDPASVDDIINALKSSIKPDNSKVIEGRMMGA